MFSLVLSVLQKHFYRYILKKNTLVKLHSYVVLTENTLVTKDWIHFCGVDLDKHWYNNHVIMQQAAGFKSIGSLALFFVWPFWQLHLVQYLYHKTRRFICTKQGTLNTQPPGGTL